MFISRRASRTSSFVKKQDAAYFVPAKRVIERCKLPGGYRVVIFGRTKPEKIILLRFFSVS